jgi:hypothetical protein
MIPFERVPHDASVRRSIAPDPGACAVIADLESALAEAGAPGLINRVRGMGLVIGADASLPPAGATSTRADAPNEAAEADAFQRARHGAGSGCGTCGTVAPAASSDIGIPAGASDVVSLPFALVAGDERVQAHLRFWSDADRRRIHQAIVIAMTSGRSTLRRVRWLGGAAAATLDIELARVDHPDGPRLVCDVIPVRGSTPPSDLGPW